MEIAPPRRLGHVHGRVADDGEGAMAAADFRLAARQRDVDLFDLVDSEALADGVDRPDRREQLPQPLRFDAVDLDVDVLARPRQQAITHPAADDQRAAAFGPCEAGNPCGRLHAHDDDWPGGCTIRRRP